MIPSANTQFRFWSGVTGIALCFVWTCLSCRVAFGPSVHPQEGHSITDSGQNAGPHPNGIEIDPEFWRLNRVDPDANRQQRITRAVQHLIARYSELWAVYSDGRRLEYYQFVRPDDPENRFLVCVYDVTRDQVVTTFLLGGRAPPSPRKHPSSAPATSPAGGDSQS